MSAPEAERLDALDERRTSLASARTALANDRTFLAWIRTALGMLAAGLALVHLAAPGNPEWVAFGAALAMLAGLFAAGAFATHRSTAKRMGVADSAESMLPGLLAGSVTAASLAGFILTLARL